MLNFWCSPLLLLFVCAVEKEFLVSIRPPPHHARSSGVVARDVDCERVSGWVLLWCERSVVSSLMTMTWTLFLVDNSDVPLGHRFEHTHRSRRQCLEVLLPSCSMGTQVFFFLRRLRHDTRERNRWYNPRDKNRTH